MKTSDVHIESPCNENWNGMDGTPTRRFCDACSASVTDLSTMTEDEAQTFVRENPDACVRYTVVRDSIKFQRPTSSFARNAARLALGAALITPGLAAASSMPADSDASMLDKLWDLIEWVRSDSEVVLMGEPEMVQPPPVVVETPPIIPEATQVLDTGVAEPPPPIRKMMGRPAVRPPPKPTKQPTR